MKRILLMRHGEAQGPLLGMKDFERSLTSKGQQQAQDMAHQLQEILPEIDAILCSSAVRTRETLANFYTQSLLPRYSDDLYYAPASLILEKLCDLEETVNFPLVISHNPGLAQLVMTLEPQCREFPPAAVALLNVNGAIPWQNLNLQKLTVATVFYPAKS